MPMNSIAVDITAKEEAFRPVAYYCPAGYPTIGHGFKIGPKGADLKYYIETYTEEESFARLEFKIKALRKQVVRLFSSDGSRNVFEDLNEVRQAVIISMCYQMGVQGFFLFSDTVGAIVRGNFEEASMHMLDSLWATDKRRGSPARANRHAEMMRTGKLHWYYK